MNTQYQCVQKNMQNYLKDSMYFPVCKSKPSTPVQPVPGRKVYVKYKIQFRYLMKAVNEVSEKKNFELREPAVADIA